MWDCGGVLKHFLLLSYFHPIRLLYTPSSASRRFQITPSLVSSGLWFYVNRVFINRCRWMIPLVSECTNVWVRWETPCLDDLLYDLFLLFLIHWAVSPLVIFQLYTSCVSGRDGRALRWKSEKRLWMHI